MNLDTHINLNFKAFWRWWRNELAFLVPERLRVWLDEGIGVIVIEVLDAGLLAHWHYHQQQERIGLYPQSGDGMAQLLQAIESHATWRKAVLGLRLPASEVLRKTVTLPKAADAHLAQLLEFELDRLTPFTRDQVYFAYQSRPENSAPEQIEVDLLVTPKSRWETLLGEFKAQGLPLAWLDSAALPSGAEHGQNHYTLLPAAEQPPQPLLPKLLHNGLNGFLLVLATLLLVLPVWWQKRQVDELDRRLVALSREAAQVETEEQTMIALIDQVQQLLDKKQQTPSVLVVLESLSRLLKDDTWLSYFQYQNGEIQFQGQSPQASLLIGMLEKSPWFRNVRFGSPVNQDIRTGLERFQIKATLSQGAEP